MKLFIKLEVLTGEGNFFKQWITDSTFPNSSVSTFNQVLHSNVKIGDSPSVILCALLRAPFSLTMSARHKSHRNLARHAQYKRQLKH